MMGIVWGEHQRRAALFCRDTGQQGRCPKEGEEKNGEWKHFWY